MKYLLIEINNEKWWIELNSDNYATRQIIFDEFEKVHISCFEDCLAEGLINEKDLDGIITKISKEKFEHIWNSVLSNHMKEWDAIKTKYPIGKCVEGICKYFYPQGAIIVVPDCIVLYIGCNTIKLNQSINSRIIAYDEQNMWLITN